MKYLPLSSCKIINVSLSAASQPFAIYSVELFMRLIALPFINQALRLFWGTFN